MCLLDYDFAILSNTFLIHRPGIKSKDDANSNDKAARIHQRGAQREKYSSSQTSQTAFITDIIAPELRHLYGTPINCSYDLMGRGKNF